MDDLKEKLEVANKEFMEEVEKWDELGVLINDVVENNHVRTNVFMGELLHMLADQGIIDKDELDLRGTSKMTTQLKKIREQIEPQVRREKLKAAGIELPNMSIPRKLH